MVIVFNLLSGKKQELTPAQLHRKELKDQWKEKRAGIMADYEKNRKKYRLQDWELPAGILNGQKSAYSALYKPPFKMRKCLGCGYLTLLAWYVDLDGRERCMLCMRKVKGPQWKQDNRPLEGSYCVVRYAIQKVATP